MSAAKLLNEWIKTLLINRDIVDRNILSFEDNGFDFVVKRKDGEVFVFVRPQLGEVSEFSKQGKVIVVTLNVRKNVDALFANWKLFAARDKLCLYFVNPTVNERWVIYPATHDKIADKASLKQGLDSLFVVVPEYVDGV